MWGFKHTMHGGAICALLDQALSLCASQHQQASKPSTATLYTADLSVKFRRPVIVPAVLALECWLERHEGRKWYIRARLVDAQLQTLSEARDLWVLTRCDL
jgi:acyl-coenzyme A thioesterase PaaI-like protein